MAASAVQVRVIYGDTDAMGVLYHANYLRFFESARTEWLRRVGARYRDMEREGSLLPVTEAFVRYLRPAVYDDLLRVEVRLAELGRASFRLAYRLVREEDGALLAEGHTGHACVGRDFRPRRLPPGLRDVLASRVDETAG